MTRRIVMIGAGNVAASLARALARRHSIVQVYSRHLANARRLAGAVGCGAAPDSLAGIDPGADTYVMAVRDDAIAQVAAAVPDRPGALWLHTSGTKPLAVLGASHARCGVLYPMQSFSREMPVDFRGVPVFVEGCDAEAEAEVTELARSISGHVEAADSHKRARLHVAAVMACNFANHLWTLTADTLAEAGIDFKVMLPLIRSTVAKLDTLSPAQSQTGPAVRGDTEVTDRQRQMLTGRTRQIYDLMTESIIEHSARHNEEIKQ